MSKASKKRQELLTQYRHKYTPHFSEQGKCFYCGDVATERDHCPPVSWCDVTTEKTWIRFKVIFVTLQCCAPCNLTLGGKPIFTVLDRVIFLEQYLSNKFERIVSLWSNEEIAEMSPEFQRSIRARRKVVNALHARILHVQWRRHHQETHPQAEFDDFFLPTPPPLPL